MAYSDIQNRVSSRQSRGRDFDISIISIPGGIPKWHLAVQFLSLRKRVFVDAMQWSLFHDDDLEFEQYDNYGRTTYVIAHRGNEVIGGARLLRTDTVLGSAGGLQYSYMIRDACLGLLPNMPTALCEGEAPVSGRIWELTRLVSDSKDPSVNQAILSATNEYLWEIGASECLFLGPPAFMKMAKRMGFTPKPLGKIQGNKDGRFLAFGCDVIQPDEIVEPAQAPLMPAALSESLDSLAL